MENEGELLAGLYTSPECPGLVWSVSPQGGFAPDHHPSCLPDMVKDLRALCLVGTVVRTAENVPTVPFNVETFRNQTKLKCYFRPRGSPNEKG